MRYATLGGILLVCMGVFVYRLVDWQLINGEQYLQQADATYVSTVNLSAARGEIVDTNGEPLAINKTGYNVTFDQTYLDSDNQNDVIKNLIHLLDQRNEPWVDELPIVIAQRYIKRVLHSKLIIHYFIQLLSKNKIRYENTNHF